MVEFGVEMLISFAQIVDVVIKLIIKIILSVYMQFDSFFKIINNRFLLKLVTICIIYTVPIYSQDQYYAYCNSFTVICAQQLDAGLINTNIGHRFYGPVSDGLDTLYGMDDGANVMLYAAYMLTDNDKVHVQRIRTDTDFQLAYQRSVQILHLPLFATVLVSANWYDDNGTDVFNGLSVFGLSWDYRFGQLHSNIGYDHYESEMGVASALIFNVTDEWDIVFEGFSSSQSNDPALSIGGVYHTFGHRFKLGLHNSTAMGFRQLMHATTTKDWVFGFQIHRLLEW